MVTLVYDLGKLTDWLGIVINAIALASGLVLLWFSKRTLDAVLVQLRSQSSHQIVEAHKTLFLPLVSDPDLAALVSNGDGQNFSRRMLGSILINHAGRIFAEFKYKVRSKDDIARFRADLRDMFEMEIVRGRWPSVKAFHDAKFVAFVEETITDLPPLSPGAPKAASESQADVSVPAPKPTRTRQRTKTPSSGD